MKVLIIGSRVPWPLRDGGAIATFNLLKGLSEAGVEVHLMTLNTKKHFVDLKTVSQEFPFLSSFSSRSIDTKISPFKAFLNLFRAESYNIQRFINRDFKREIQKKTEGEDFDIVHFEGLYVAYYAAFVKSRIKILRQHNVEFKIWETLANTSKNHIKRWYLSLLSRRLRAFENGILHHFNAIVDITEEDKNLSISTFNYSGIRTSIPAGIEPTLVSETSLNPNSVYHIGSMEWMPNRAAMQWFHDEVWPRVLKACPEAIFYMAGKNMPESFKRLESKNFIVAGEVENRHAFSADKAILVVPLQSGSGIRIKTLEAMIDGKAVISTSLGAKGLPLIHLQHCLIADSSEGFAEALIKLLQNPEDRKTISKTGQAFALEHYGNRAVSLKWKAFYLRLIEEV